MYLDLYVKYELRRVVHISLRSLHRVQYIYTSPLVLLRHFPVRHFPVRHFRSVIFSPSFSSPANSSPANSAIPKAHVGDVRLDVGCDNKRLVYEYRIEPLKCDRDALKQECRLARIADSGTQPPTHLSEKIQRARSYCPQSFERDWYKKKALWRQEYLASVRSIIP